MGNNVKKIGFIFSVLGTIAKNDVKAAVTTAKTTTTSTLDLIIGKLGENFTEDVKETVERKLNGKQAKPANQTVELGKSIFDAYSVAKAAAKK